MRAGDHRDEPEFAALLEDNPADLYENAPCGYVSTLMDGRIVKINRTLLTWLGRARDEVVGRMRFADLLTVGGKLYHETHFAPLLRMQGEIGGIALELRTAAGARLPVLVTSKVRAGADGRPLLIRSTVFDAGDRRAYEIELLRAREAAEAARAAADRAREDAQQERRRLQEVLATLRRSLLPPALPDVPGLAVAAHYHTASPDDLGGDFYDLYPLGDGRWGFFLGDVSGHGPGAAAVASLARYTLRAAALHDSDPASLLAILNTAMYEGQAGEETHYCTIITGVLTRAGDGFAVTFASGGHPPPVMLRAGGGADYLPTTGGVLIGLLPEAPSVTVVAELRPGDTLLLYTDGLIEARTHESTDGGTDGHSDDEGRYGDQALLTFAGHLAPATPGGVIGAMAALLDELGEGLDDDAALLALGVTPDAGTTGAGRRPGR
ncbi:SpoIIE family protein phosphatase [Nonomuraea sp. SBT364]|uniref:SpoIIE family protein phosphatase n=1 Tax=Nonomuraea sp. SBT364 TaxID=1580530 RepID=UPI00066E0ED5|nr:SpoIIE family protein phosphatase [Nonomuraea sp. SBT364]